MNKTEKIVIGGGCFWCVETVFSNTKGVISAISGYAGGNTDNPNYDQVSMGRTGHAEVVEIEFNPEIIDLEKIFGIFFTIHDPTTLNRQGHDVGTQYRSIILFSNEEQKQLALEMIKKVESENGGQKVVTEVLPLKGFFPAEEYHQHYFEKNPDQAYCQLVVAPKLAKFREKYKEYYK